MDIADNGLDMNNSVVAGLSNSTTLDQEQLDVVPSSYYTFIRDIYFTLNGIVLWSGLVFNTISLLVFATSASLRHTTTGHYLMALSVSDSAYLVADLFRWLGSSGHSFDSYIKAARIMHHNNMVCKLTHFVRYTTMLSSSWITVAITVERFLTIKLPLKISRISTPKIAKISIACIFLFSCALCIYPFWCVQVGVYKGNPLCLMNQDPPVLKVYKIMVWVSVRVMTLIIPCAIVMVLTVWIIWLLHERDQTQYALQAARPAQNQGYDRRAALERQLTIMLVAVAIAFLVLRLPYAIIWDINHTKRRIWSGLLNWTSYNIYVAYKLTDIMNISNYAINFFLYFLCGSAFRKQLRRMMHCPKARPMRRRYGSATTNSSQLRSSSRSITKTFSHSQRRPSLRNNIEMVTNI